MSEAVSERFAAAVFVLLAFWLGALCAAGSWQIAAWAGEVAGRLGL